MQRWRRCAIYAILKQKPYSFTTNMLKAYLSTQPSSLSAFMINKTHQVGQKPRGRQLNTKACGSESPIFVILSFFVQTTCQTTITQKWLKYTPGFQHETDAHHSAQLPNHSVTSQLQIYTCQKSCSQHCPTAVHCEGHHFLSLVPRHFPPPVFDRLQYAKTEAGMAWERGYHFLILHTSSLVPKPKPRSFVWERD